MAYRINPALAAELENYGAANASECFNCGNCSAVCSLTEGETVFPRKFIRYMQLGLTDKLIQSPDPWLCYYCGECSDTCPREAEPGELMMSARRWLTGKYDVTGLARIFYTSSVGSAIILVVLAVILGLVVISSSGSMGLEEIALWSYLDSHAVHNLGLGVIGLVVLFGLVGVINMVAQIGKAARFAPRSGGGGSDWFSAIFSTAFTEILGHRRYITCDEEKDEPWHQQRWFVHGSTAWGFFGLLIATMAHWILDMVGLKETATWVPMYSLPIRMLGIVAGIFLVYGSTTLLMKRINKGPDKQAATSAPSDWVFLLLLWIAGITGFLTLIGEYAPPMAITYYLLLIHVVLSMELVLLAPFTKFAHVFYRSVAIYIHQQRGATKG